jgi:hypothetical protein
MNFVFYAQRYTMKPLTLFPLIITIAILALPVLANPLPAYLAHFAGPIHIDGKLDEAAWSQAEWTSDFVWIDTGGPVPLKSRAKVLYDQKALYFAFECTAVKQTAALPFNAGFAHSCEVFLDPEGRGKKYLEYAAASNGYEHSIVWHGRISMSQWKGTTPGLTSQCAATRVPLDGVHDLVTYEVAFPWDGMGDLVNTRNLPPAKGAAWRMNFSRVERGEYFGDYVWSPPGIYYMHQPNTFGWLVFAGALSQNPLTKIDPARLVPLPDAASTLGSKTMVPFNRLYWTFFPLLPNGDDYYGLTQNTVSRFDAQGKTQWTRSRRDGLPQYIRSAAMINDTLWLSGKTLEISGKDSGSDGVFTLNKNGVVSPIRPSLPGAKSSLYPLDNQSLIIAQGDKFQIVEKQKVLSLQEAEGDIHCAAKMPDGSIVLGTGRGFELYAPDGELLKTADVAGGITSIAMQGDTAIGVCGDCGLIYFRADGECGFFPFQIMTKFDKLFADAGNRCWASYEGGIALIDKGKVHYFDAPLGLEGLYVTDGVAYEGKMIFAAMSPKSSWGSPSSNWYASGRSSSLLLIYDKGKWRKISFEEGLPAQINALAMHKNKIFLSTNGGVFNVIFPD